MLLKGEGDTLLMFRCYIIEHKPQNINMKGASWTARAKIQHEGACVQQLMSYRRFRDLLDTSALVAEAASALQDKGLDNTQDIYKTCLSILHKACLLAPSSLAPHTATILPALQRLLLQKGDQTIQQEVRLGFSHHML
jgi:hypothetical protein